MISEPKVYILLLNWNRAKNTIDCLNSIFDLDYNNFSVVLCDNDSTDNSIEIIKKELSNRNISFALLDEGETVGNELRSVTIIRNKKNYGFAEGNNIGIQYVVEQADSPYLWVLNNDTKVEKNSLRFLVERMNNEPNVGLCGSLILEYGKEQIVQAIGGGKYNNLLGSTWHLGGGIHRKDVDTVLQNGIGPDYIMGASMFVRLSCLPETGLMPTGYFLYYEDIEWSLIFKKEFLVAVEPKSIVYHKEGGTIGSSANPSKKEKSVQSDYFSLKNRIRFMTRCHFYALPIVYLSFIGIAFNRIFRGQYYRLLLVVAVLLWVPVPKRFLRD